MYIFSSPIKIIPTIQPQIASQDIILINSIFLLFALSSTLFFYSLYDSDEDIVDLKFPSFFKSRKGTIRIGKSLKKKQNKYKFFLSLKDLEKHVFVCGATGTGKSNFIQYFLINLSKRHKIPFLLVEFKGEYHFLQKQIDNLLIIRPGENFAINIFNPEGAIPEVHAERIFDILKSGQFLDTNAEFSPQMQKVLVEILTKLCKNKTLQSWDGFYSYCKEYSDKFARDIPMLSQTLISIKNRIRRFSLGSLKALFDTEHKIRIKDLFERNILIDLSSIIRLGGEKADALFFLNMVLKYLWDKNITRGAYQFKGIKHITIVEDAQYFAPKDLSRQTKLSSYLEDIALLQRGTGECLICIATHPDISEDILANCGALIVFKTHMQREFLCELLNLNKEKQDYMSILEEGQCIARVNSIKRPFLLSIPYVERDYLNMSEINYNNKLALNAQEKMIDKGIERKYEIILRFLKGIGREISSIFSKIAKVIKENIRKLIIFHQKKKKEKEIKKNFIIEEEITYYTEETDEPANNEIENEEEYGDDFKDLKEFAEELYLKEKEKK